MEGGKPLMQVLKERKTERDFLPDKLSLQTLSDLLWAACGINREESSKRTAPTANNWQEISLYVAMQEGLYLYDPMQNQLILIMPEDIRGYSSRQDFSKTAPLVLIFVSDFSRMGDVALEKKIFNSATDTGYISQNVYLFAASEGLSTVVVGSLEKEALENMMGLRPEQKVILTQSVGYPAIKK